MSAQNEDRKAREELQQALNLLTTIVSPTTQLMEGDIIVGPVGVATARRITLWEMLERQLKEASAEYMTLTNSFSELDTRQGALRVISSLLDDPKKMAAYKSRFDEAEVLSSRRARLSKMTTILERDILREVRQVCRSQNVSGEFVAIDSEWNLFTRNSMVIRPDVTKLYLV